MGIVPWRISRNVSSYKAGALHLPVSLFPTSSMTSDPGYYHSAFCLYASDHIRCLLYMETRLPYVTFPKAIHMVVYDRFFCCKAQEILCFMYTPISLICFLVDIYVSFHLVGQSWVMLPWSWQYTLLWDSVSEFSESIDKSEVDWSGHSHVHRSCIIYAPAQARTSLVLTNTYSLLFPRQVCRTVSLWFKFVLFW